MYHNCLNEIGNEIGVQEHWNVLEHTIIKIVDYVVPLVELDLGNKSVKPKIIPSTIKNKINLRKRLLRDDRLHGSNTNRPRIKEISNEVAAYFKGIRVSSVKRAAAGGGANLWKAVKLAKNLNTETIPEKMTLNNIPIAPGNTAESFAGYFSEKIKLTSKKCNLNDNVYNGKCKLIVGCRNFMNRNDVEECMSQLGTKKCEGFDRIPVCTIFHSKSNLLEPMAALFDNIYKNKVVPEQWKI